MSEDGSARRAALSPAAIVEGIRAGDRSVLARAITLVESRRLDDRKHAQEVLDAVLPVTGSAVRGGMRASMTPGWLSAQTSFEPDLPTGARAHLR